MVKGPQAVLGDAEFAIANDVPLAWSEDGAMFPMHVDALARDGEPLVRMASCFATTSPAQLALERPSARSPIMLLRLRTSTVAHLEEAGEAMLIEPTPDQKGIVPTSVVPGRTETGKRVASKAVWILGR
jgi:hypothetical protein